MSTQQVKRWRVYCTTESIYVDGYIDTLDGTPITCFNNNTHSIDTSKTELIEVIDNNYTQTLVKWEIYCTTERQPVYGFLNEDYGSPLACFNNNNHLIGYKKKIEIIKNAKVETITKLTPSHDRYRMESIKINDIAPNSIKTVDATWPIDASPLSFNLIVTNRHKGDTCVIDIEPDSVMGSLAEGISGGVTNVISVDNNVILDAHLSFYCSITDGINTEDLGQIIDIDYQNNTITVENTPTYNYSVETPTYIRKTIRYIGPYELSDPGTITLGGVKQGLSLIPRNKIVRITYTNNSSLTKDFYINFEYLY